MTKNKLPIDQDAVDELMLWSQNNEPDYLRAMKKCDKIITRMKVEPTININVYARVMWDMESRRLHASYMSNFGLRNGLVKSKLSVATFEQLSKELKETYDEDIKYKLEHEKKPEQATT